MSFRTSLCACIAISPAAPFAVLAASAAAADVRVTPNDRGAAITVGDQPFADYLIRSGPKPVVWPIFGPGQVRMTRDYPLDDSRSDETRDHIHHRSLWFTHGDVNKIDFWAETPGAGHIEHREFVELKSGPEGVIVTRNEWLAPDGRKILEDQRRLTFAAGDDARTIDFDIELKATAGPVEFGDTKEGSFGVRVADVLAVKKKSGGQIKNDAGLTDKDAWGKPASWVDYHGRIDGQPVGVAMMNHPDSFGFPTRWHVRDYGLFAANPFGSTAFEAPKRENVKLESGGSIKLSYRVLLHRGDEQSGDVAAVYKAYAGQRRP